MPRAANETETTATRAVIMSDNGIQHGKSNVPTTGVSSGWNVGSDAVVHWNDGGMAADKQIVCET
ncbi:uncharacterized protein GLRG_01307 [Colletotrichum graminicola M1.001]|uniref:Uncharacterized protein n=1 Tax=Colletotrichum graminicola (strain M1.001 / M2 / FGSC 10212) TaxID=645133 RepID=E3Q4Z8_COLGM|nr:uncharacterized protein GLRG_01307 [Colletotrichum graminicola M1.001]EFQ26163.1 hypothetical protein GLRG_01307 [Colletotrichum graminicola M1.001]